MAKTEFSKFIDCIKPMKEQNERIEEFTRRILEIYTPYNEDDETAKINRSNSTLKKYSYGSEEISREFANDLLKYKSEIDLEDFFYQANDSISSAMLELFQKNFPTENFNHQNLHNKASILLTNILSGRVLKSNKKSTSLLYAEDLIGKVRIVGNVLELGNSKIKLPDSEYSKAINKQELNLKYLPALIQAYSDAEGINYDISNIDTLKKVYKENFETQRINFYEADCIKRFSRDSISSGEDEFQNLLDDTYDGVINTRNKSYINAYERLLSVLEQSSKIDLTASSLYQIPKLITNKRKAGFCHMLVNDGRLSWIDEEEDDEWFIQFS